MKIDQEGRMTIKHLAEHGFGNRKISRLLSISEESARLPQGAESLAGLGFA